MMPDMTGIEFYETLKKRFPGFEKRVIFMTGGAFTAAASEFMANVPNLRVEKPFTRQKIQDLIVQCLGSQPKVKQA
jgi:two-component system, cell cycle sensor histidine kinase and response regulator CckA